MALITLLTDYGEKDHYSAAIKAKILEGNSKAVIIDISKNVPPFNIIHASQVLRSVFKSFPEGTVHMVDVYAHGQGKTSPIALKMEGHLFVGPNNGIFSLISEKNPDIIVELLASDQGRKSFPAKNVLAKAAMELSHGKEVSSLGNHCSNFEKLRALQVKIGKGVISGNIIHMDSYGNAISNIPKKAFEELRKIDGPKFRIEFGRESIRSISESYGDVMEGELVAFFNDLDLLEIAICEGDSAALLGLEYEVLVKIHFSKS
jgi:S-adenosylmethionine hydrolase